jgi:outer membrane PBP1 activator LpoA protein
MGAPNLRDDGTTGNFLRRREVEEDGYGNAVPAPHEAVYGNAGAARELVVTRVENTSSRDVRASAAMALAFAGDSAEATTLINDLGKDFSEAPINQRNYVPTVRARVALNKGDANGAIKILETAKQYELGQTTYSRFGWNAMRPVYVRARRILRRSAVRMR